MTTDTRTPQEIEYDRLALSTRPTPAQPEAPTTPSRIPSEEDVIGTIDGCPVHPVCSVDADRHLYAVQMHWRGIRLETNGHSYIELPVTGEFGGDCTAEDWRQIKLLAHTDIVEQLYSFAQSVVPAEPLLDDDDGEAEEAPIAALPDRQAFISDTISDTFIMIEPHSGDLALQTKGSKSVLLTPAETLALYRFFQLPTIGRVMLHVMFNYHMAHGSDDLKRALEMVHQIMGPMPPLPEAGQARVEKSGMWYKNGDFNYEGVGELAWTEYGAGTEANGDTVLVAFPEAAAEPGSVPDVILFQHDAVPLDRALRTIASFQRVLSDPRVLAELARYEASTQPATKRAA